MKLKIASAKKQRRSQGKEMKKEKNVFCLRTPIAKLISNHQNQPNLDRPRHIHQIRLIFAAAAKLT